MGAVVGLGGDGTLLKIAKDPLISTLPLLGINLGQLGFMAQVPVDDLLPSLEDLLEGRFTLQRRSMLEVEYEGHSYRAFNEACIHRGSARMLLSLDVTLNDNFLCSLDADGVLVATANGSTAYSLSAGGPILMPELSCLLLTPICPHTLSHRSLVLESSSIIEINRLDQVGDAELIIDGEWITTLAPGKQVRIHQSLTKVSFIMLSRYDYHLTLRNKLGWSSRLRPNKNDPKPNALQEE